MSWNAKPHRSKPPLPNFSSQVPDPNTSLTLLSRSSNNVWSSNNVVSRPSPPARSDIYQQGNPQVVRNLVTSSTHDSSMKSHLPQKFQPQKSYSGQAHYGKTSLCSSQGFREKTLPSGGLVLVEREEPFPSQSRTDRATCSRVQSPALSGQWSSGQAASTQAQYSDRDAIHSSDLSFVNDMEPTFDDWPTATNSFADNFSYGDWTDEEDSDYITSFSMDSSEDQWRSHTSSNAQSRRTSSEPSASSGEQIRGTSSKNVPTHIQSSANVSPSPQPTCSFPPPPFPTPPKLRTVEQVMNNNKGTDLTSLRRLTTALAREAIFGRDELIKHSLTGRCDTLQLDGEKVNYIKTLVRTRVPNKSKVEFEEWWKWCKGSLSKSCQTLRSSAKKKMFN